MNADKYLNVRFEMKFVCNPIRFRQDETVETLIYGDSQGRVFNPLLSPEVVIWYPSIHNEQRKRRQGSSWKCFQTLQQYLSFA